MNRPLRIYVAGASSDLDRVRRVQRCILDFGGEVTVDWTRAREAELERFPTDADVPAELRRQMAARMLRGIRSADLFWLLSSRTKSEGRTWEHCAAHHLELERPDYQVVVSGPVSTLFVDLTDPARIFDTDDLALAYVRMVATMRRAA